MAEEKIYVPPVYKTQPNHIELLSILLQICYPLYGTQKIVNILMHAHTLKRTLVAMVYRQVVYKTKIFYRWKNKSVSSWLSELQHRKHVIYAMNSIFYKNKIKIIHSIRFRKIKPMTLMFLFIFLSKPLIFEFLIVFLS